MKSFIILLTLISAMNLYAQNNPFCQPTNNENAVAFKISPPQSTNIDTTIKMGILVEKDTIQFFYVLNKMSTLGKNLVYENSTITPSDKLYITLENKSTIILEAIAPSCKFETAPLNKTFSDIYTRYRIVKKDLKILSKHNIRKLTEPYTKSDTLTFTMPNEQAKDFKNIANTLNEKVQKNEVIIVN